MNIYDDYISYLDESMDILDKLRESNSLILLVINDVLKVTDYIYQRYDKKIKIDEDTEEIFTLGFGYLSNVITDIKTYYEECFDKNIDNLNKCSNLIINLVILDDFKSFLDVSERLTKEISCEIDQLMERLDRMIANQRSSSVDISEEIYIYIDNHTPSDLTFHPVYTVFAMIAEEISITDDINF